MNNARIVLLRGGPSDEYDVSMQTGKSVLESLKRRSRNVQDVVITRDGAWLLDGKERKPEQILASADVVFIALHGTYGEDGSVQRMLERHHLPFTGSNSFPSAIAFNKKLTKDTLQHLGIAMPQHTYVTRDEVSGFEALADRIITSYGPEYIIKPVANGSSAGIKIVREGQSLRAALEEILAEQEQVLVEEFIRGEEATCGALEDFRGESLYVFPTIEIVPPQTEGYFSRTAKYNGQTQEICPARFTYPLRKKIEELTAAIHTELRLAQYSRSDFMVRDGVPYFLEVNTLPGLTAESLFPKAAAAVGLGFDDFIEHLIETAKP